MNRKENFSLHFPTSLQIYRPSRMWSPLWVAYERVEDRDTWIQCLGQNQSHVSLATFLTPLLIDSIPKCSCSFSFFFFEANVWWHGSTVKFAALSGLCSAATLNLCKICKVPTHIQKNDDYNVDRPFTLIRGNFKVFVHLEIFVGQWQISQTKVDIVCHYQDNLALWSF